MHELAVGQAIIDTVERRAGDRPVRRVIVRIGHLRQVVPDSLQFSWQLLVDGTDLEGCELAIEHVPAVVECTTCGAQTTLQLPVLACAACGSFDVELRSGEEFMIVGMDIAQPALRDKEAP
ncbi:MAG: hydrogenase maturation nickel metallochaperone HypA [Ilumatobacteraceae bacterium]